MATTAAPYGFRPVGVLGAGTFSGATRQYKVTNSYGTSIFYGDVVKLVAAGTVEKDTGTTALTPLGIFVGCSYTDPGTNQPTYARLSALLMVRVLWLAIPIRMFFVSSTALAMPRAILVLRISYKIQPVYRKELSHGYLKSTNA